LLIFKFISNVVFAKESWKIQTPLLYFSAALILIPSLLSLWSYTVHEEKKDPIEVVVTQPNIDPYNEKFTIRADKQIQTIIDQADSLITKNTSIVLGPETAIPYSFDENRHALSRGYDQVKKAVDGWEGPDLYLGASTYRIFKEKESVSMKPMKGGPGFYEHYNTSLLLSRNKPPQFIHKSKLVLGVEKVPFSNWFPSLEELSVNNGGTSGTLGIEDEAKVMRTGGYKFAPVVCYESIYGGFVAAQCRLGAEAIFVITNDGWWGDTPGHKQHASFARLRAVETGKYVVRSANTGISSVINQRGEVIHKTEYWVKDAFKKTINLNDEVTFYVEYGDVIGRSFGFVFFLLIILTLVKYLRRFGTST
jgi:apolipoprotein N-acyltransferase